MQYLERLRVYLQSMIKDDYIVNCIMNGSIQKEYKAGEYILQKGKKATYVYFTISGMSRSVHVYEDGREATIKFYPENSWCCLYNFLVGETANVYVEAIEDTIMAGISVEYLKKLVIDEPRCQLFFVSIYSKIRDNITKCIDDFKDLTIQERYNVFLEQYSEIQNRIERKYIASYIGATKEEMELLLN